MVRAGEDTSVAYFVSRCLWHTKWFREHLVVEEVLQHV
jgi:hypothetical protein